jgi:hypothetical protein
MPAEPFKFAFATSGRQVNHSVLYYLHHDEPGVEQSPQITSDRIEHRFRISNRPGYGCQNFPGRRLLLSRLFQFAGESGDLFWGIGGGYVCGRRFVSLGPSRAQALYRFFTSTASLHVAPLGDHDDAQFYASSDGGTMSALGHKQTYASQQGMSALPPIATEKADIGKLSCLLYP